MHRRSSLKLMATYSSVSSRTVSGFLLDSEILSLQRNMSEKRGLNPLKCPECSGVVRPGQERCDHCGVWFKNPISPTLSTIMADNDRSNKPIETISYYGDAYVPGSSGIGVSVSGNVVLSPSTPGMVARVIKRVSGRVVEETSEYVIVMTRKDQLVKIRPEDIIRRKIVKPLSDSDIEKRQRLLRTQGTWMLLVGIALLGASSFLGKWGIWGIIFGIGLVGGGLWGFLSVRYWSTQKKGGVPD